MKDELFIWQWGKKNVRVPFSDKDLSEFEMLWVQIFQITEVNTDKTSVTRVRPKTFHCSIFAFRATNAVLDPDRVKPSWCRRPQERPLLNKLSNYEKTYTNIMQLKWERRTSLILLLFIQKFSTFLTGSNPPANFSQPTGAAQIWKWRAIYHRFV